MPAPTPGGLPMPQAPDGDSPPMGMSPATSPTDNAGSDVQGMQHASLLMDAAAELLPQVGANTPVGKILHKFIGDLGKIVQPGAVSPAGKQNQMDSMQRNNMQNAQNLSMIQQGQQPGAPGGAPQQPGQAA